MKFRKTDVCLLNSPDLSLGSTQFRMFFFDSVCQTPMSVPVQNIPQARVDSYS